MMLINVVAISTSQCQGSEQPWAMVWPDPWGKDPLVALNKSSLFKQAISMAGMVHAVPERICGNPTWGVNSGSVFGLPSVMLANELGKGYQISVGWSKIKQLWFRISCALFQEMIHNTWLCINLQFCLVHIGKHASATVKDHLDAVFIVHGP